MTNRGRFRALFRDNQFTGDFSFRFWAPLLRAFQRNGYPRISHSHLFGIILLISITNISGGTVEISNKP